MLSVEENSVYLPVLAITGMLFASGILMIASILLWPRGQDQNSFGFKTTVISSILYAIAGITGLGVMSLGGTYHLGVSTKIWLFAIGPGVSFIAYGGLCAWAIILAILGKQSQFVHYNGLMGRLIGSMAFAVLLLAFTFGVYFSFWSTIYQIDVLAALAERILSSGLAVAVMVATIILWVARWYSKKCNVTSL